MPKLSISCLLILLILAGCSAEGTRKLPGVYRIDIQQGNVIEQEMLDKIGMAAVAPVGGVGRGDAGTATAGAASNKAFADIVQEFAAKSVNAGEVSELNSLKAVDNDAELVDIVTAVSNAEITLDTVVTLRDRVISAYQEIIKMPI